MARRAKEASFNFRLKQEIKDHYDAIVEALTAEDRRGRAFGKGEILEWFCATFAAATDRERAEILEWLQDGMEAWVALHKAGKLPPSGGGPPGHGVGRPFKVGGAVDDPDPRPAKRGQRHQERAQS